MIRLASYLFAIVVLCLFAAEAIHGVWPIPAGLAAIAFGLLLTSLERDVRVPF